MIIIAVDPGKEKCGVAVVDSEGGLQEKMIIKKNEFKGKIKELNNKYKIYKIIIGRGTGSKEIKRYLQQLNLNNRLELVDEYLTSWKARERYFQENPPKGIRKIIPLSLQIPPEPYDDYVALLLAEKYFKKFQTCR